MENKPFIFTEAYDCGIILKKCLESFFVYHPDEVVNVFGTAKDFKELGKFKNVEYFELSSDLELKECFKHGHMGTAHIGARVIQEFSSGHDFIIHFDSDVIFRKESLSLLLEGISEGYDLIGPRRCYKNNANGRTDLSELADVTQTYFYAFNKNKISELPFDTLRQMIVGFYNPLNHPILDYFDPVAFNMLNNGASVKFLASDAIGGLDENGSRDNKFSVLNNEFDFGENLIHFGGIGSGAKFYHKGPGSTPESYVNWAKKRFAIYSELILEEKIDDNLRDENLINTIKTELQTNTI